MMAAERVPPVLTATKYPIYQTRVIIVHARSLMAAAQGAGLSHPPPPSRAYYLPCIGNTNLQQTHSQPDVCTVITSASTPRGGQGPHHHSK